MKAVISAALLAALTLAGSPSAALSLVKISGTASVIDGDTIEIHGQRIRLHGIDSPESRQRCMLGGEEWRCGTRAANALDEFIDRSPVTCSPKDIDRYQRVVAVCTVRGEDINAWMVSEGWAVAYRQYSRDYVSDEAHAQSERRGMWAGEFQMPWDWRKQTRKRH